MGRANDEGLLIRDGMIYRDLQMWQSERGPELHRDEPASGADFREYTDDAFRIHGTLAAAVAFAHRALEVAEQEAGVRRGDDGLPPDVHLRLEVAWELSETARHESGRQLAQLNEWVVVGYFHALDAFVERTVKQLHREVPEWVAREALRRLEVADELKSVLEEHRATLGLAAWWRDAERVWEANSKGRLTLREQLDYRRKLTDQVPAGPHRVLYAASGMHLAARTSVTRPPSSSTGSTGPRHRTGPKRCTSARSSTAPPPPNSSGP